MWQMFSWKREHRLEKHHWKTTWNAEVKKTAIHQSLECIRVVYFSLDFKHSKRPRLVLLHLPLQYIRSPQTKINSKIQNVAYSLQLPYTDLFLHKSSVSGQLTIGKTVALLDNLGELSKYFPVKQQSSSVNTGFKNGG